MAHDSLAYVSWVLKEEVYNRCSRGVDLELFLLLADVIPKSLGKAQACIAAMHTVLSHGMGRIILESDSVNTVKELQSDERDLSPASVPYKEARELISTSFISVQIPHIPRSCNIIRVLMISLV
jgi:hypothetical protein